MGISFSNSFNASSMSVTSLVIGEAVASNSIPPYHPGGGSARKEVHIILEPLFLFSSNVQNGSLWNGKTTHCYLKILDINRDINVTESQDSSNRSTY
tara:strand:+ start:395 stop:685 length:291 start_codon:yes stop_codon:yes gene_type:complete